MIEADGILYEPVWPPLSVEPPTPPPPRPAPRRENRTLRATLQALLDADPSREWSQVGLLAAVREIDATITKNSVNGMLRRMCDAGTAHRTRKVREGTRRQLYARRPLAP